MNYKTIITHSLSALFVQLITFLVLRSDFFSSIFMPKCEGYECMGNAIIMIVLFVVIAITAATVAAVATYKKSDVRKKESSAIVVAITLSPLLYILLTIFG